MNISARLAPAQALQLCQTLASIRLITHPKLRRYTSSTDDANPLSQAPAQPSRPSPQDVANDSLSGNFAAAALKLQSLGKRSEHVIQQLDAQVEELKNVPKTKAEILREEIEKRNQTSGLTFNLATAVDSDRPLRLNPRKGFERDMSSEWTLEERIAARKKKEQEKRRLARLRDRKILTAIKSPETRSGANSSQPLSSTPPANIFIHPNKLRSTLKNLNRRGSPLNVPSAEPDWGEPFNKHRAGAQGVVQFSKKDTYENLVNLYGLDDELETVVQRHNPLSSAHIAGVQSAKMTSQLLPLSTLPTVEGITIDIKIIRPFHRGEEGSDSAASTPSAEQADPLESGLESNSSRSKLFERACTVHPVLEAINGGLLITAQVEAYGRREAGPHAISAIMGTALSAMETLAEFDQELVVSSVQVMSREKFGKLSREQTDEHVELVVPLPHGYGSDST